MDHALGGVDLSLTDACGTTDPAQPKGPLVLALGPALKSPGSPKENVAKTCSTQLRPSKNIGKLVYRNLGVPCKFTLSTPLPWLEAFNRTENEYDLLNAGL